MFDLQGKVAIVTGGAGGIGAAIVHRLCLAGAHVAIADIRLGAAQALAQKLESIGATAMAVEMDVTQPEEFPAILDAVEARLGPINVLVNNAGWDHITPFLESTLDMWARIIAVNLTGPIALSHEVLRRTAKLGNGRIINIGSDAGRVGSSGEAVYSACKGGIAAFAKTLAREFARQGVTVNTVCPGPTDTELLASQLGHGEKAQKIYDSLRRAIPMKRLGEPEDVVGAVAFFASEEASFVTGQTLSVSGGLTMAG